MKNLQSIFFFAFALVSCSKNTETTSSTDGDQWDITKISFSQGTNIQSLDATNYQESLIIKKDSSYQYNVAKLTSGSIIPPQDFYPKNNSGKINVDYSPMAADGLPHIQFISGKDTTTFQFFTIGKDTMEWQYYAKDKNGWYSKLFVRKSK